MDCAHKKYTSTFCGRSSVATLALLQEQVLALEKEQVLALEKSLQEQAQALRRAEAMQATCAYQALECWVPQRAQRALPKKLERVVVGHVYMKNNVPWLCPILAW